MFSNPYEIKSRNIVLAYASSFISGLLFFLPIWALYVQKSLFTVENVALIISIQAISTVIFEFPTGAVGDLFGRKRTILLGKLITFCSVIFLYIGGNIWLFILYAILASLGAALVSGTDGALIYDTLKEEKKEKYYKKILGSIGVLWPLGAAIASVVGGYLAQNSLSLPILITLVPLGLDVMLATRLQEPKYEKETHRDIFLQMRSVSGEIMKNRQLLLLLAFSLMIYGLGESMYLLNPIFFDFKEIPLAYFGYVFAASFALSSIGHYFSHDVSERIGNRNTLLLSVVGTIPLVLLATMAIGMASAFFIVLTSLFFGLRNPVIGYLINIECESKRRATILSASSLAWQLGKFACAPLIGYLADLYTINTAFMLSALLMIFSAIPVLFLKDR